MRTVVLRRILMEGLLLAAVVFGGLWLGSHLKEED